jgi:hypothetical protein
LLGLVYKVILGFSGPVVSGSNFWPKVIYLLKGMNAVQDAGNQSLQAMED